MVPIQVLPGMDDGLLDGVQLNQRRLDLRDLDAVTPDFYLKVFSTQAHNTAVRQFVTQVPHKIHSFRSPIGVWKEDGTREVRLVPITGRQITALHCDLAHAAPDLFAGSIQQYNMVPLDGIAHGHVIPGDWRLFVDQVQQDTPGFSASQPIDENTVVREMVSVHVYVFFVNRFSYQPDQANRRKRLHFGQGIYEMPKEGRDGVVDSDFFLYQPVG